MSDERSERSRFGVTYKRGLRFSAVGNSAAYGYSVTITASFGLLTMRGTLGVGQILTFVVGAVLAVALVEAVASGGFRHEMEEEPSSIMALGSSISVFSVGSALGLVFLADSLVGGFAVWPLGSFLATVSYLSIYALEISVADAIQRRARRGEERDGEL